MGTSQDEESHGRGSTGPNSIRKFVKSPLDWLLSVSEPPTPSGFKSWAMSPFPCSRFPLGPNVVSTLEPRKVVVGVIDVDGAVSDKPTKSQIGRIGSEVVGLLPSV